MSEPTTPQDIISGQPTSKCSPTACNTSSVATNPVGQGATNCTLGNTPSSQPSPATPGQASSGDGQVQGSTHPLSTPPPPSSVLSQSSGPPTPQHGPVVPNSSLSTPCSSSSNSLSTPSISTANRPPSVGGQSQINNNTVSSGGNTNSENSSHLGNTAGRSPHASSTAPQSANQSPIGSGCSNQQPPHSQFAPGLGCTLQQPQQNIGNLTGGSTHNISQCPPHSIPQSTLPAVQNMSQGVPPINTSSSRSAMESQYMQQSSQIFVFNTTMANEAAEAVQSGHFVDILHFHCTRPQTMSVLEKNPLKIAQFQKPSTHQWLREFPYKTNIGLRPPGPMFHMNGGGPPPHHMNVGPPHQQPVPPNFPMRGPHPGGPMGYGSGNRFNGPPNNGPPYPPMGQLRPQGQMNQFVNMPNQDFINDKNLTPQQRRDRESKLAKLDEIRQQLCPELDPPPMDMMHPGPQTQMHGGPGPHGMMMHHGGSRMPIPGGPHQQVPLSPHQHPASPHGMGINPNNNFGPRNMQMGGISMGMSPGPGTPHGMDSNTPPVGPTSGPATRLNSPKANGKGRGRTPKSANIKKERPPSSGDLMSNLDNRNIEGTPPLFKNEPALIPVPSPQQIQYLNAFEGQELTIQKQPNTSLSEADLMTGPGGELDLGFAGELVGTPGPDPKFPPPMDNFGGPPIGPPQMSNGPRFPYNEGPPQRFMGHDQGMGMSGGNRFQPPVNQFDPPPRLMGQPVMNDLNGPPISYGPGCPPMLDSSSRMPNHDNQGMWPRPGMRQGPGPMASDIQSNFVHRGSAPGGQGIGAPMCPLPPGSGFQQSSDIVSSSSTHLQNLQKMTPPFDLGPPTSSHMRANTNSVGSDPGKLSNDSISNNTTANMMNIPSHTGLGGPPNSNQFNANQLNGGDGFSSSQSPQSNMGQGQSMPGPYSNQMNIPPGYTPSEQTPPLIDGMGIGPPPPGVSPQSMQNPLSQQRMPFPNEGQSPGPMSMNGPRPNAPPVSSFSPFPNNGGEQVKPTNAPNRPNTIQYLPTRGPSPNSSGGNGIGPRGMDFLGQRFPPPLGSMDKNGPGNMNFYGNSQQPISSRPVMSNGPSNGPPPNMMVINQSSGPMGMGPNDFGPPTHGGMNQMGPGLRQQMMSGPQCPPNQFGPGMGPPMKGNMGGPNPGMMMMDGDPMGQPLAPNMGNGCYQNNMPGSVMNGPMMGGDMNFPPPGQGQYSYQSNMYGGPPPMNNLNPSGPRMTMMGNMPNNGNGSFFSGK